nr:hypothetical protein Iba_chr03aCG10220 [Ipomoea batatas]
MHNPYRNFWQQFSNALPLIEEEEQCRRREIAHRLRVVVDRVKYENSRRLKGFIHMVFIGRTREFDTNEIKSCMFTCCQDRIVALLQRRKHLL